MRRLIIVAFVAWAGVPTAAFAQGFAIGPRVTFIRGSEDLPEGSRRFIGGALRLGGGRAALEVAMDFRSSEEGPLNQKIRDYPIQASLLLYPVRARVAPYLMGGVGWYSQQVTRFVGPTGQFETTEETTREMGWHGGVGVELRLHRRFGIYGDIRYTQLGFGRDDDDTDGDMNVPGWVLPGANLLRLSHEGSRFVLGANVIF